MKLLGFTLAMIVVPIGSYFLTIDSFFQGSVTPINSLVSAAQRVRLTFAHQEIRRMRERWPP